MLSLHCSIEMSLVANRSREMCIAMMFGSIAGWCDELLRASIVYLLAIDDYSVHKSKYLLNLNSNELRCVFSVMRAGLVIIKIISHCQIVCVTKN